MRLEHLSPKMRMVLLTVPIRNEEVEWVEEDGRIVLIYPKNFTRLEKFLHRHLGGPENIRRPLDDKGTFIWKMCDGDHNIHDICKASYQEFKEDIEPVVRRVWGFIETLLNLNLITVKIPEEEEEEGDKGEKTEEDLEGKGSEEEGEPEAGGEEEVEGEETGVLPPEEIREEEAPEVGGEGTGIPPQKEIEEEEIPLEGEHGEEGDQDKGTEEREGIEEEEEGEKKEGHP